MTTPAGSWTIALRDPGYPPGLRDLGDVPPALFGAGSREAVTGLEPDACVTIVGARRATPYGRGVAEELGRELAAAGLIVVSGMAYGIDSAAHRGAIAGGGITVAVLAGGPDVAYPPSARRLHREILASGGAAVSELEPGVTPSRWAFPARNRLMAALAAVTVVVEATERSGTRHTADAAERLHRTVGVVPGPVTSPLSAGPNALLFDGAAPVRDAQDVLDLMLGVGVASVRRRGPVLEPGLAASLAALAEDGMTYDAVTASVGGAAGEVAVALARLELMGYVRVDGAGRYARTGLRTPSET
jgi:DNA processing protein